MLESFKTITASVAFAVEAAGAVLVAYGAAEAVYSSILTVVNKRTLPGELKEVWLRFGVWLLQAWNSCWLGM